MPTHETSCIRGFWVLLKDFASKNKMEDWCRRISNIDLRLPHAYTYMCSHTHVCSHTQTLACTPHRYTWKEEKEKGKRKLRRDSVYLLCIGDVLSGAEIHSYRHWVLGYSNQVMLASRSYPTVLSPLLTAFSQHCMTMLGTEEYRVEWHLWCHS